MTTTEELLEKLRMLKYDYDSMSTSLEDAIDDIAYELEQAIAATLPTVNSASRWHELFGTPERAARMLEKQCDPFHCVVCPAYHRAPCNEGDYDALLEWLKGADE